MHQHAALFRKFSTAWGVCGGGWSLPPHTGTFPLQLVMQRSRDKRTVVVAQGISSAQGKGGWSVGVHCHRERGANHPASFWWYG